MSRKILLFFISVLTLSLNAAESEQILMTIGNKKITKSEFEYIFFKNNDKDSITKDDLDEYLDLFINFKLKVLEAESRGMDTTQAFVTELDGYREQLAKPYLTDRSVDDFYMKEAYERLSEEVKVSHVLIGIEGNKSPSDTLVAYNKAMEVRQNLINGADFPSQAKQYSVDPSAAQNGGMLGYFKGFQMIYQFESAAFNTPVGDISMPVRTQYGYHVLKVHDKRQAQGDVKVAHIMKMIAENATEELVKKAEVEIRELYKEVKDGGDFAEIAKKSSDDYGSAQSGGALNWFSTGNMVREFEQAAFALKENGDISEPIRTQFGWHIIKLLDKRGIRSYSDSKEEIKRRLQRDPRGSKAFENFIDQCKKEYKYTEHQENIDAFIDFSRRYTYQDSMFQVITRGLEKPVMTLDGIDFTQEQFADYLIKNPRGETPNEKERVKLKWDKFNVEAIVNYEKSILEKKYSEFRFLMQEYHDGILLFEISSQEVWDKASKDEAILKKYYKKVRKKYKWEEPHFNGKIVRCVNDSVMAIAKLKYQTSDVDSTILGELNADAPAVSIENGSFSKGQNDVVDYYYFEGDKYAPTVKFNSAFALGKIYKAGTPKEFELIKGNVTSDYQNYLEKQWIKMLRKKFKTSVNKDVLKTIEVKK